MQAQVLAARTAQAGERIRAATELLAERFDMGEQGAVLATRRSGAVDPGVARLFDLEAVADLLERLVVKTEAQQPQKLAELEGIGPEIADALAAVGVVTVPQLNAMTDEALLKIAGIGKARLAALREVVPAPAETETAEE